MTFSQEMAREKTRVALTSVLAAVGLTTAKFVVGFMTGSLGILSEALHSALDLAAALITYISVRISDKPPDEDHSYGHGKIESVSSLIQTGLLIITCVVIIKAAIERILFDEGMVEVTVWSFVVLVGSVIVDYSRSRALYRIARKFRSQALEADALHFSSDIWSSLVVIAGLVLTSAGFVHGDSAAAIGVAVFVLVISFRLLKRTLDTLTDTMPKDIEKSVRKVLADVDGLLTFRHLRVRQSGSKIFIDMYVMLRRTTPFEAAHSVTDEIERRIAEIVPNADIVIHPEPRETEDESIIDKIRMIVQEEGLACHNVRAQKVENGYYVDFHLECEKYEKFSQAHEVSTRIESRLKDKIPSIRNIKTHIEDARDRLLKAADITGESSSLLEQVREVARKEKGVMGCDDMVMMRVEGRRKLMMNVLISGDLTLDQVHAITTSLENRIYLSIPDIHHVVIHPESSVMTTTP